MEIKLNLSSRPYLNRQSLRLWLLFASAIMVLLLIFNGSYAYQNYQQLQQLDERFKELKGQISENSGAAMEYSPDKYAEVKAEVALGNDIIASDQFKWTKLLDRLEELTPADVRIVSVQPNFGKRSVQLTCRARSIVAMTEFMDNLLGSEDMNKVYLKNHGEVESQQGGSRQTQVSFSLAIEEAF